MGSKMRPGYKNYAAAGAVDSVAGSNTWCSLIKPVLISPISHISRVYMALSQYHIVVNINRTTLAVQQLEYLDCKEKSLSSFAIGAAPSNLKAPKTISDFVWQDCIAVFVIILDIGL